MNSDDVARIAIVYDRGQYQAFPPVLAVLGFEDMENECFDDAYYESIINPAEFTAYGTASLNFDKNDEYIQFFNQMNLLYQEDQSLEDDAIGVYIKCCIVTIALMRKLNRDVLVFCTDPELVDLKNNLASIESTVGKIDVKLPSWLE